MANVKTAISIDKPLFEQVDGLAHELNTSRSRIFALAATEFIQRHKNLKLLEAINAAYDDFPDEKEASLKSVMRFRHLKMVKDQW
ncbi:MAG: CopG family transcriptional regulator [Candidatus Omnitrophota bacterium]|nr:CopG family transcriptional regulator [Candidatus Omnitrophota bacterium]